MLTNPIPNKHGMTLVEMIFASGVMMIVMAGVFQVILAVMSNDKRSGVEAELRTSAVKVMERIQRGDNGLAGLMKAREDSVALGFNNESVTFSVDQNNPYTVATGDDTPMRIYVQDTDGLPATADDNSLIYDPDTVVPGDEVVLSTGVLDVEFGKADRLVSVELTLERTVRGGPVQIALRQDIYLRN